MVYLIDLYKTGDAGETSLGDGRDSQDRFAHHCYGAVDELNSHLGAFLPPKALRNLPRF